MGLPYQVTGNDIVITKIEDLDDNGFLIIPSYIDGKRVIALASMTFHEASPEAIYLPKTLLALHRTVLLSFRPYLFVSGEVLAVEDSTEPWRKIITTKTCVDQHGEKFSNLSSWQEWSAQTYVYRTATSSDVGDPNYQNTDGDIVITGIDMLREDYVYDIPAYIDGKKVVAIGEWALSNTRAIAIYVPATVKCVGIGAFNYCMYRASIYFRGDSIYAASNPFDYDSYVTLRCSATCRNGDKGYYKDLAKGYNVTWKEWNG